MARRAERCDKQCAIELSIYNAKVIVFIKVRLAVSDGLGHIDLVILTNFVRLTWSDRLGQIDLVRLTWSD